MAKTSQTMRLDGSAVRRLRERKGMTLRDLANISGISFSGIGKLERGEVGVGTKTILRLAEALGVSIDDIAVELEEAS